MKLINLKTYIISFVFFSFKGPISSRIENIILYIYRKIYQKVQDLDEQYKLKNKLTEIATKIDTRFDVVNRVEDINNKYHVKEKVIQKVKEVEEKFHIVEKTNSATDW